MWRVCQVAVSWVGRWAGRMDGCRVGRMGAMRVGTGVREKAKRMAVWRAGQAGMSRVGRGFGWVAG